MPQTVIIHITNEEPFIGDIKEIPNPGDNLLVISNPRRRDGRDVKFLAERVTTVVWPWQRINFLEVLPNQEEEEEIISSIRE